MKHINIRVFASIVVGLTLLLASGCKKDDVAKAPSVTTTTISAITTATAASGGNVTSDGGATVTSRGVCWSTAATPTISDSKTSDGGGIGSFTSNLTGLSPSTDYHVRAYAINATGTVYGNTETFTTLALPLPELTTDAITNITLTEASTGGTITSDGGLSITARGVCWSVGPTPTITNGKTVDGVGVGSFVSGITGLTPNTSYTVRAYATTSAGTGYGNAVVFTTQRLPVVVTTSVNNIHVTTAGSGGSVSDEGSSPTIARGVCWGPNPSPTVADSKTTDGFGTGGFTSSLTGLNANATYYARAYASNSWGTSYGTETAFITFGLEDIDGNQYHSVIIGTQEWMAENLKSATYRDGVAIVKVELASDWINLTSGAYANYDNSASNAAIYGALYNWYAVSDMHQLCPSGWRAPDDTDWNTLAAFLGGEDVAGGKMKATGTTQAGNGQWNSPNTGATNESKFAALPGGLRGDAGEYNDLHSYGHWWSSVGDVNNAYFRRLQDSHTKLERFGNSSTVGKSVRCLKD